MIVIDTDMPKSCEKCFVTFCPCKRTNVRDKDICPIKCDIEQIRAEIERLHYHPKLDFIKNDVVVEMALDIIDKYIK